jgi:hypothetical protein
MAWTLLRHEAVPVVFGGIRAQPALMPFLQSLTWGNAMQLQMLHRPVSAELRC